MGGWCSRRPTPTRFKARPQDTPLYRLVEAHYEEVRAQWEERFESGDGRWRGFVDGVVMRYLDCGLFKAGFASVQCRDCHAAWETVSELMAAAAVEVDEFCPGMVVVAQTAGDALRPHPHPHSLVPRGGWACDGAWAPVPFVDPGAAERLFRHKVLSFLNSEGLLSDERTELILSWQHHTGFSDDSSVRGEPEDGPGLERLTRYIMRPPLSLERRRWCQGAREVAYTLKPKEGQPTAQENVDPLDLFAR